MAIKINEDFRCLINGKLPLGSRGSLLLVPRDVAQPRPGQVNGAAENHPLSAIAALGIDGATPSSRDRSAKERRSRQPGPSRHWPHEPMPTRQPPVFELVLVMR